MKYNRQLTKGFTIIEVLIVLAIAGVILSIVFLVVPQQQRSARNNQRNADAAKIASAINECLSNNNGVLASCLPSTGSVSTAAGSGPILAPSGGTLDTSKLQQLTTVNIYAAYSSGVAPADNISANVYSGYNCSGSSIDNTNVGANQFVVLYNREGGGNSMLPVAQDNSVRTCSAVNIPAECDPMHGDIASCNPSPN